MSGNEMEGGRSKDIEAAPQSHEGCRLLLLSCFVIFLTVSLRLPASPSQNGCCDSPVMVHSRRDEGQVEDKGTHLTKLCLSRKGSPPSPGASASTAWPEPCRLHTLSCKGSREGERALWPRTGNYRVAEEGDARQSDAACGSATHRTCCVKSSNTFSLPKLVKQKETQRLYRCFG